MKIGHAGMPVTPPAPQTLPACAGPAQANVAALAADGFASTGSAPPSQDVAAAAKALFAKPGEGPGIPPEVVWSFQAPSTCEHPPLPGPEGNIYVRASETAVFALDSKGNTLWTGESTTSFGDRPSVDDRGNIYYIDKYGIIDGIRFMSYDSKGEKRWEVKQKIDGGMGSYSEEGAPLTTVDEANNALIARFQNRIYSMDLDTGKPNWSYSLFDYAYDGIGRIEKGPEGSYYISCNHDRAIHVLDPATGKEVRKIPALARESSYLGLAVGDDGAMYCTEFGWDAGQKGLRAMDRDGNELWFAKGGFEGKPLLGPDNLVYLKRKDGKGNYSMCALDASTGKQKWGRSFTSVEGCDPMVTPDGSLIVKVDAPGKATKATAGAKKWSRAMGEDPVSRIFCIDSAGRDKWIMEPGFWVYTSLSLDEKNNLLYASDNGGGCIAINLDRINEAVEERRKAAPAQTEAVRIEIREDYVDVDGIRLPVRR